MILLLILMCTQAYASSYTMRDLEALEAQKSYQEFLQHAMDIRPSERGTQWVSMVADMAIGLIDFKITRLDYSAQSFREIEKLALWPTLQNDEFFQTKRAKYLRRYLPQCFKKSKRQDCTKDIVLYWNNSPKDVDLGVELAQLIKQHSLELDPWSFISKAPLSQLSHIFCEKPLVQDALLIELTKPTFAANQNLDQLKGLIESTLNDKCWQILKPTLSQELLVQGASQLKREAIYKILKAKEALKQEQEDIFLVSYILQGPIIGETFNLAWTRVRELGEDYPRRQRVFEALKEQNLLPDGLFGSANVKSRDVIMAHIDRFFPEYFSHYAKSCLNYRQGLGHYPKGNPTLHCSDFFKISEDKNWVEQSLKLRYSGQLK